jgi:hypothetical protein
MGTRQFRFGDTLWIGFKKTDKNVLTFLSEMTYIKVNIQEGLIK